MFNAPAAVWNKIAEQQLKTTWAQEMFPLPPDLMGPAIVAELNRVTQATGNDRLARAYLKAMPLWWEAAAIRAEAMESGSIKVPMVSSVEEAVAIGRNEETLSLAEAEQLHQMLLTPPV